MEQCAYRLSSFEPIVEALLRVEYNASGWKLWIRHRHYGGLFGDCEPEEVDRLTVEELIDVLEAHASQWGPSHPPT